MSLKPSDPEPRPRFNWKAADVFVGSVGAIVSILTLAYALGRETVDVRAREDLRILRDDVDRLLARPAPILRPPDRIPPDRPGRLGK